MKRELRLGGVGRADVDAACRRLGLHLANVLPADGREPRRIVAAANNGVDLVTFREEADGLVRSVEIVGHAPHETTERLRQALGGHLVEGIEEQVREPVGGAGVAGSVPGPPAGAAATPDRADRSRRPVAEARLPRAELPVRPRLAGDVSARVHVRGGTGEVRLSAPGRGTVAVLTPDAWRLLRAADGTRDLDALALAAADRDLPLDAAAIRMTLEGLAGEGLLEDGLPQPARSRPVPSPPRTPATRPLEVLPDFHLRCDRGGSCCRFYGSVTFSEEEAKRAAAVGTVVALPPDLAFTPDRGARQGELAVALIDGRCAFLAADGACRIHREAGASAKPYPCRTYPASFVDDGVAVRVSAMPECACVFRSALVDAQLSAPLPEPVDAPRDLRFDPGWGQPLVPPSARVFGDLPPQATVRALGSPVALTARAAVGAADVRRISLALADACARAKDPAAFAFRLADALESSADAIPVQASERRASERRPHEHVAHAIGRAAEREAGGPGATAVAWLRRLADRVQRVRDDDARATGSSALSHRTAAWLARSLADGGARVEPPTDVAAERFYLRALAFGHRVALEGRPLSHGLRDRGTRILAARRMARTGPESEDPAARWPLALVEAALRNLRLAGYADGA
ncbi:MAG: YkgJ family cysteine cluster protein [Sandaracinaceae bacterium]